MLVLGTALWGWGVSKREAYEVLDSFVQQGQTWVDAATNYPINKNPQDWGLVLDWLEEWIRLNPGVALKILVKVGSKDNSGGARSDLSKHYIDSTVRSLMQRFEHHLGNVSIHWDNRDSSEEAAIGETLSCFEGLVSEGIGIGFSGVAHPEIYYELAPQLREKWYIQVKENPSTAISRGHYEKYFHSARYIAYGTNLGGFRFDVGSDFDSGSGSGGRKDYVSSAELRNITVSDDFLKNFKRHVESVISEVDIIKSLYDFNFLFAYLNPRLDGLILGPRNTTQLLGTLRLKHELERFSEDDLTSIRQKVRSFKS